MARPASTGQIPTGWNLTKLGEILAQNNSGERLSGTKLYRLLGVRLAGQGPFLREEKLGQQIQASHLSKVSAGDFIYSRLFAWRGAFGVISKELDGAYVSNEFPTFSVDRSRLDAEFLRLYFSQAPVWSEVETYCTGTTKASRNRFKEEFFLGMEIPLPPLDEQRRIVSRIKELAASVEEAKHLRQRATLETQILTHVVARKTFSHLKETPTVLGDWLDDNREGIQTGPFGAQLGSADFVSSGIPVLMIGNVQYGGLRLNGLKYVSEEKAVQLQRYRIKKGDLLFARMGTVGRCCIVPPEAEAWLINYHIIRVGLDHSRVDPHFVLWAIRSSDDVAGYLDEKIRGATRQGVNSSIVRNLPCRIPSLTEQRQIVAYLSGLQSRIDVLREQQKETTAELDALMPSILSRAFRGEL